MSTAMKVLSFYPPHHPSVRMAVSRLLSTLQEVMAGDPLVELGFGEAGVLYQGEYLPDPDRGLHSFCAFLLNRGIARLSLHRGLDAETLSEFLRLLATDPARTASEGGLTKRMASRGVTTIQVGEIDLEKILASEADPLQQGSLSAGAEGEAWKRLVTDFLRSPGGAASDGLRALFHSLATDARRLSEVVTDLAGESPGDLPRSLGRLAEEIRRDAPELMDEFARNLGEASLKLEPRMRMNLMLHKIPLSDGTPDFLEKVTQEMTDPMIVDLVSSFVEAEQQLSPRLFSVCSKVFAARGKTAPFLGPITARLQNQPGGNPDLGRIWQSLQGLLVESDHDYLSETYKATLEEISNKVEGVDEELRAALAVAPGYGEAFSADGITDHACRVIMAALEVDSDEAQIDSLRDDLDRRAKRMSGRERLPLLGETIRALAEPRAGDLRAPGRAAMDKRVRSAAGQMVRVFRSEFERLTEEERVRAGQAFRELGGIVAPILVDGLAEEENWEVRKGLLTVLTSLGRAAAPVLLKRLNDPSWFLVRNATLLLGEIGGQSLVEPLSSLLRHEEPRVRREAATALGKVGGPRSVAQLRQAVLDPEVSSVAARVLAEIDRDNTVALFSERLARAGLLLVNEGPVREAITVLGEMEAVEAVPVLSRILNRGLWIPFSAGDQVRSQAAQALRRIGTLDAMKAIRKAARSTRRLVRDTCESLADSPPAEAGR